MLWLSPEIVGMIISLEVGIFMGWITYYCPWERQFCTT